MPQTTAPLGVGFRLPAAAGVWNANANDAQSRLQTLEQARVLNEQQLTQFNTRLSALEVGGGGGGGQQPGTVTYAVRIDGSGAKTVQIPLASNSVVGTITAYADNVQFTPATLTLGTNPGGFWVLNGAQLRVNQEISTGFAGQRTIQINGTTAAGAAFSGTVSVTFQTQVATVTGTTKLGMYAAEDDAEVVHAFEAAIGRQVDLVLAYNSGYMPGDWDFLNPTDRLNSNMIGGAGRRLLWSTAMAPDDAGVVEYQRIANGEFDEMYKDWARTILAARASDTDPIYVRTTWELPGEWMPWSHVATTAPDVFIAAWRRFSAAYRSISSRFEMVWDVTSDRSDPTQVYPGDSYVQVLSLNAYWSRDVHGTDPDTAWQYHRFGTAYDLEWGRTFAKAHGLKLALGEWGVQGDSGIATWLGHLEDWVVEMNGPGEPGVAFMIFWQGREGSGYDGDYLSGRWPTGFAALKTWWNDVAGLGAPSTPTTAAVRINSADTLTVTSFPIGQGSTVGSLTISTGGPAQSFSLGTNPNNMWQIVGNQLRVTQEVTATFAGTYNITVNYVNAAGTPGSDGITVVLQPSSVGSSAGLPRMAVQIPMSSPAEVASFEAFLGRAVDGVLAYSSGSDPGNFQGLDPRWQLDSQFVGGANRPIMWSINFAPDDAGVAEYQRVANGEFDDMYEEWAGDLLAHRSGDPNPIYIRSTWEIPGEWFPWSAVARADPGVFKAAWARWAAVFHGVSTRFKMVWDFNSDREDPTIYYPGNTAVDIISQDPYWTREYQGNDPVAAFEHTKTGYAHGLAWMRSFAAARGKQQALSEYAANGDDAGPWYDALLAWVQECKSDAPIAYMTYWNDKEGSGHDGYRQGRGWPNADARFRNMWNTLKAG